MSKQIIPSADEISAADFKAYLDKYEDCIEAISASKASKPGDKTLAQLDKYRYGDAIDEFSGEKPKKQMELDHVKTLVQWKLRHGKFRPTLMNLVSSNPPDFVKQTVKDASDSYTKNSDAAAALAILTKLKGIGPATASLLLAVLDPDRVIFFADEAFYWLCCGGKKESIKYNAKEYQALSEEARKLCKRLKVKAVDVERVAFVIMRQQDSDLPVEKGTTKEEKPQRVKVSPPPKSKAKKAEKKPGPTKRKAVEEPTNAETARTADSPCETLLGSQLGENTKFDMEAFSQQEPIPLQPRFAEIKRKIVSANPDAIAASWNRLLRELKREIDLVITMNAAKVIPSIDFQDLSNASAVQSLEKREDFSSQLKKRGVGIIRGVVPHETAVAWKQELDDYIWTNPQTRTSTCSSLPKEHAVYKLFWSPAQIKARAHPNVLAAQKFAMSHWSSPGPRSPSSASSVSAPPLVSHTTPVSYADRIIVPIHDPWTQHHSPLPRSTAQVDNGSVERWEPDGYGRARTYSYIFEGWWEGHDPWDASARVLASPDLYGGGGRCSVFRMFQGWLSLGHGQQPSSTSPLLSNQPNQAGAGLAVLPLLKHTTAYFLLRPFFSPGTALYSNTTLDPQQKWSAFLSESNWTLLPPDKQDSILHGALPSYAQEINSLLHPHLRLAESLVPVPTLDPGDYLIWHPDLVHAATTAGADGGSGSSTMICLPACPLTQGNVLYLAQQRKAFLAGATGPDFASGGGYAGETGHVGRPGTGEVGEAGGEEGLRAMGLWAWDEDGVGVGEREREREARRMGNGILFPDGFGGV
ncbi:hypothetical protein GE09DRAFT_1174693 [Coniochaeta sp. 2T2.1]|nr:hypothetical protein GE09DRAFT_1174693 [Coniochaeta sp. 2T2.1]